MATKVITEDEYEKANRQICVFCGGKPDKEKVAPKAYRYNPTVCQKCSIRNNRQKI